MESLRTVVGLAARNGLKLHQLDITAAFLNGDLEEEVFMQQPEGFILKGQEQLVCKLRRSIYGLKQSPRCWNFTLDKLSEENRFSAINERPLHIHCCTGRVGGGWSLCGRHCRRM